jgi:hypothetical protein
MDRDIKSKRLKCIASGLSHDSSADRPSLSGNGCQTVKLGRGIWEGIKVKQSDQREGKNEEALSVYFHDGYDRIDFWGQFSASV